MPITSVHPNYSEFMQLWERCEDCNDGQDSIKSKGEMYLPKPSGQTQKDYKEYLARALYFNALNRTVQGLTGAVMKRNPKILLPQSLDYIEKNCDGELGIEHFSRELLSEVITTGRAGVLVDRDETARDGVAAPLYLTCYEAEEVINWRESDGSLTLVVLAESMEVVDPADNYLMTCIPTWRELVIQDGIYIQRIWRQHPKQKNKFIIVKEIVPNFRGKPLDFIPFVFVNACDLDCCPSKPPLLDIADISISHFQTSADLEQGAHYTACPTLVITGFTPKIDPKTGIELPVVIQMGSKAAITITNNEAQVHFLEFKGDGLKSLEERLKQKENQMAILGARMLEGQRKGVEAAETARLRQSGEMSALTVISKTVSAGIKKALQYAAKWERVDESKIEFELNSEFLDTNLTPLQLTALVSAYQSGGMTLETFLFNLQSGELLPPGTDISAEAMKAKSSQNSNVVV